MEQEQEQEQILTDLLKTLSKSVLASDKLMLEHRATLPAYFRVRWRNANLLVHRIVMRDFHDIDALRGADTAVGYVYEDFLYCIDYYEGDMAAEDRFTNRLYALRDLRRALEPLKALALKERGVAFV